jgi:4'-phosphopantetheinyl transferase
LLRVSSSAEVLGMFADPMTLLTGAERARAEAALFEVDRADFVAAHLLARLCAADLLGVLVTDVTIVQRCPVCAGPHGRPSIVEAPTLGVSWSHADGHVAALCGPGPLGVDLELASGPSRPSAMCHALAPAEAAWVRAAPDPDAAFTRLWVRKEALIKAGLVSLADLSDVDLIEDLAAPAQRWRGVWLTGWEDAKVIAACATPVPLNSCGRGYKIRGHKAEPSPRSPIAPSPRNSDRRRLNVTIP